MIAGGCRTGSKNCNRNQLSVVLAAKIECGQYTRDDALKVARAILYETRTNCWACGRRKFRGKLSISGEEDVTGGPTAPSRGRRPACAGSRSTLPPWERALDSCIPPSPPWGRGAGGEGVRAEG